MKKLIILAIILFTGTTFAADLVCDPIPENIGGTFDVSVDSVIVATDYPAEADGSIRWNVDAYGDGSTHTFTIRYRGLGGWPSDWSVPLDGAKPMTNPMGLTIQ